MKFYVALLLPCAKAAPYHHRYRGAGQQWTPPTETIDIGTTLVVAFPLLDEVNRNVGGQGARNGLSCAGRPLVADALTRGSAGPRQDAGGELFAQRLARAVSCVESTYLSPASISTLFVFDQRWHQFAFRRDPVHLVSWPADEINRTPPKTQAALLEAMQESQITVEGEMFGRRNGAVSLSSPRPTRSSTRARTPARGAARPVLASHQFRLPDSGGRSGRSPTGGCQRRQEAQEARDDPST